jgi:hypothetical protein
MSGQIWYRHDGLDTVTKQPKDAQAQLAQSGWFPLSDEDVAALEQAAVDAVAADEKAMTAQVAESAAARDAQDRAALADAEKALAPPETPTKAPPRGKTSTKETE